MHHLAFSATLAEQHRDQLRRQVDQAHLARASRPKNRRWQGRAARLGRPATRPSQA